MFVLFIFLISDITNPVWAIKFFILIILPSLGSEFQDIYTLAQIYTSISFEIFFKTINQIDNS